MHQSASQLSQETTSSERTGRGSSASLHQPSSQLRSDPHRQESSPTRTGSDSSAVKYQSTSQLVSDRPRPDLSTIWSYMGWTNIVDVDSSNNASDDNPFLGPKVPVPGKVSVNMPTEDWLCKKLSKLKLTVVEGYPTRCSEAGGLVKDQFLRPAKSQSKWYGLFSDHKVDSSAVSTWSTDTSKLNSCFSRIARQSGLTSTPPASRLLSQETLRRWEKSSREATVICNQAASFNRCLFKVQQNMQEQMKTIRTESKGKGSARVSSALDELQFLMDFNVSITQAAAKTMEHLSEFVFISMGNLTLPAGTHI